MTRLILGLAFLLFYPLHVLLFYPLHVLRNLRERGERIQRESAFDAAQKLRRSQERRALDFRRARERAGRR